MKEFEKIRIKFKANVKKAEAKRVVAGKEGKGLLKSISQFFTYTPKTSSHSNIKK